MAEAEEDLLGKADALMARHRPTRTGTNPYADIPMLDEVVDPAAVSDELPVLTEMIELDRIATVGFASDRIEPGRIEPELLHEEQSTAPAQSLHASLLAALRPEIDRLIEERLKQALEPLVVKLFEDLQCELQSIAHATLSEAIHTAVERELGRRRSRN
jgi:hypothetical protein